MFKMQAKKKEGSVFNSKQDRIFSFFLFNTLIFFISVMSGYGLLFGCFREVYKKGEIVLSPEKKFGMNTDWNDPGIYKLSSIVVAKDGCIFSAISRQHKICKFDPKGKLLKKFSRKGQGPGDTHYPSELSILDDKYLIISEYSTNRRISLFDLNGNFYKIIRTNFPVNSVVCLKDNKIAIMSISYLNNHEKISVYIKDVITGVEKCVDSSIEELRKIKTDKFIIRSPFQKKCFISKTIDGNLLVGFNDSKIISMYSYLGDKTGSFEIDIRPTPVTANIVSKIKEKFIGHVYKGKKLKPAFRNAYNSFEKLLGPNLPLYSFILTDEQGNILVFYYHGYNNLKKPGFQVYSPQGEYICNCVLNFGNYENELMDFRFKRRIVITENGLFGIFSVSDGDNSDLRIIKVDLN